MKREYTFSKDDLQIKRNPWSPWLWDDCLWRMSKWKWGGGHEAKKMWTQKGSMGACKYVYTVTMRAVMSTADPTLSWRGTEAGASRWQRRAGGEEGGDGLVFKTAERGWFSRCWRRNGVLCIRRTKGITAEPRQQEVFRPWPRVANYFSTSLKTEALECRLHEVCHCVLWLEHSLAHNKCLVFTE